MHPYLQEWTLKIRILTKTDLHTFTNAKEPGHVFSSDVIEIDESEIHITCFNIQETHFHPSIDIGKVYIISKGIIKLAKKEFNYLKMTYK